MSRAATKTDNSFFEAKVKIRLDNLPSKKSVRVLDCFAGEGLIWSEIQKRCPKKSYSVLAIDEKRQTRGLHLVGDNLKFLASMDLSTFDVIDLDAYGIPAQQLRIVLGHALRPRCVIQGTFIQSQWGGSLPNDFLSELGYSKAMVGKIPSIFYRDSQDKLFRWLAVKGVRRVKYYSTIVRRKTYFCFILADHRAKKRTKRVKDL